VKRIFIALIAGLGLAWIVAAASAQQYPVPQGPAQSQPVTQPPPPPPPAAPDLANCNKHNAKMSIASAKFNRFRRTTSLLAPITKRASGFADVQLLGGGRITEFSVRVDSERGLIRATRGIDRAQARTSTVILTLRYNGDADTRPQTLRLRAALRAPKLSSRRPTISPTGRLDAAGAITRRAEGVVRVQLEWVNSADGSISTLERKATIRNGRWGVRSQLPPDVIEAIGKRCSTVQSFVVFTGYQRLLMRGQMRAYQVMPAPAS